MHDDHAPTGSSHVPDLGIGIDAGGTYTDAVLFDFALNTVVAKAKAITRQWDLAAGITEAIDGLPDDTVSGVRLVCVSTTLATNAIVENRGWPVGLLVMPPYGRLDRTRFRHAPLVAIRGQMDIDGEEIAAPDPDEILSVSDRLIRTEGVRAFALAGYASHNNPAHELFVRDLLSRESGLPVTCGHELSESLNYRIRAETAALNARILPCLADLLDRLKEVLAERKIRAPVMVVKSDGSLMGLKTARQRPVETILSGPAASVAGALHLARVETAIVVDIGGTTTDTAGVRKGLVQHTPAGASVGGWRTHVPALDMRTLGLGGDSTVHVERNELHIGPTRRPPLAWLALHEPAVLQAIDWMAQHRELFETSTRDMEILMLLRVPDELDLTPRERALLKCLESGPMSLAQAARELECHDTRFLPLSRLDSAHVLVRGCLTPTDLLNTDGRIRLWNTRASAVGTEVYARLQRCTVAEFADRVFRRIATRLAGEIFRKAVDAELPSEELDGCPGAGALLEKALNPSASVVDVQVRLGQPVIGIGAPAHCLVPQAADRVHTNAVIPEHADVANAVGAITGNVFVHRRARIDLDETGQARIKGIVGAPVFDSIEEATDFASENLKARVLGLANSAGTQSHAVEIDIDDHCPEAADGKAVFVERIIEARLVGAPVHRPAI